ncbi:PP_RS20740 family protein, partial [Xanthomonas phaseoli]|uniref:PP_RS20740 family protein n=1 Tax=Xanthomonas phaseoli TaxID=1985254 RepID=UPI001E34ABAC
HQVCLEKEIPLQFLGFMSGSPADEIELNISNDEVMRLPNVDKRSSILLEDFESLADASSVGFTRFQGVGSFDVVNIDLCNSFGGHAPEENETYYKAIHRIIDSQRSRRPPNEPWIMFLTTRANIATVNVDAKCQFLDCLIANVQSHSSVRDIVNQSLSLTEQDLLELRSGSKNVENFEEVFAAAVGKWLLKLMGTGAPQGTIELLPTSCTYGIRSPKSKDMLSLGFIFKTNISSPVDPTNLSSASTGNVGIPAEPDAACSVIQRIPQMDNVDALLLSEAGAYERIALEAAELMRIARFDYDGYMAKVNQWPECPAKCSVS